MGDTAVYDLPLRVQGSRITAPYLDDRIACAVLLAALERIETPSCDLYRTPFLNRTGVYAASLGATPPNLPTRRKPSSSMWVTMKPMDPSCDLYMAFTVQEEVGLRGAKTAAWRVDPDTGIVVDVTDVMSPTQTSFPALSRSLAPMSRKHSSSFSLPKSAFSSGTNTPRTPFLLALEQYAYCNDIVDQGVGTIGALADGLMKSHNWYFWWD